MNLRFFNLNTSVGIFINATVNVTKNAKTSQKLPLYQHTRQRKKGTPDQLPVYPANWKSARATAKLIWYIKYRFYDDNLNQSKQVVIKGMNDFNTLKEKQDAVAALMDEELYEIKTKGFNKITGLYSEVKEDESLSILPF